MVGDIARWPFNMQVRKDYANQEPNGIQWGNQRPNETLGRRSRSAKHPKQYSMEQPNF